MGKKKDRKKLPSKVIHMFTKRFNRCVRLVGMVGFRVWSRLGTIFEMLTQKLPQRTSPHCYCCLNDQWLNEQSFFRHAQRRGCCCCITRGKALGSFLELARHRSVIVSSRVTGRADTFVFNVCVITLAMLLSYWSGRKAKASDVTFELVHLLFKLHSAAD